MSGSVHNSKGRGGRLTAACADGTPTQIFSSNETDRKINGLEKIQKNQQKLDEFLSRTTSDFGTFEQPIKYTVVNLKVWEKALNNVLFQNSKTVSW
jgi:hypothetical protein